MLPGVVERGDPRGGEVLGHRERLRAGRDLRQRHRAEVLLDVPDQGVADPLVVEHPAGHQLAVDRAVGGPQQQADRAHRAALVDPHRDGVDVEDGQPLAGCVELLAGQPGLTAVEIEVAHAVVSTSRPGRRRREAVGQDQ